MTNVTGIPELEPLVLPIKSLVGTVEVIVGGIFGLYLIFALFQLYYAKRKDNVLKEILEELKKISSKNDSVKIKKR